jgi:hypothetical protein
MADLEDRLRRTLQESARRVPARVAVPPGLVRRAGRRITRNIAGGVLAVGLVAVALVGGVNTLRGSPRQIPITTPTLPTSPGPTGPACLAENLSGKSRLMGSGVRAEGYLVLTNEGAAACSLEGWPTVRILDAGGVPLRDVAAVQADGPAQAVTVPPGGRARIRVVWTSWCGVDQTPTQWEIELPGRGQLVQFALNQNQAVPRCSTENSELRVGPFVP